MKTKKTKETKAVLIVDNDIHAAQQLWDLLKYIGHKTISSRDLEVVDGIVGRNNIDAVILKPTFEKEGDGLELARKLKEEYGIKIVISKENGENVEGDYIDAIIQKPYKLLKKRGRKRVLKPLREVFASG